MLKKDMMKILKFIGIAVLFIFMSSGAFSQTKADKAAINTVEHYTDAVDSYLRGLNEKNLALILSLYADSATVEDPVGSDIVAGFEAITKFYSGAVTLDLELTRTGPVRIAANEAAFPFELVMEVDEKMIKSDIIDVFRFDEAGKIVSMRAFWGPSNRKEVKTERE